MDKQKEIEKMACDMCLWRHGCNDPNNPIDSCVPLRMAERAVEVGYGDVREAVKEFADKVLSKIYSALDYCPNDYEEAYHECFSDLRDYINDLVKEMCGDEVPKNDKA